MLNIMNIIIQSIPYYPPGLAQSRDQLLISGHLDLIVHQEYVVLYTYGVRHITSIEHKRCRSED